MGGNFVMVKPPHIIGKDLKGETAAGDAEEK
jgi:hypothetical protein